MYKRLRFMLILSFISFICFSQKKQSLPSLLPEVMQNGDPAAIKIDGPLGKRIDARPSIVNGDILDFFWTFDNGKSVYLNIHARKTADRGITGADMWDTGIPGQPAPPALLPDGRIVMVYVDRTGVPIIKLRVSNDGGKTWSDSEELNISHSDLDIQTKYKESMQDAWSEMEKFSIGLPTTAHLKGGEVLAVYYEGPKTDFTGIRWALISWK